MTSPNTAPPHLPWSEALRAVKDVTVDSFDAVLRKSAMALVIFQAPWCAQCKQMAPDVAQVAAAFRSAVIVARVDAEGNDELLDRFDVASYPRILWFDGSNEWPFFASEVRKPEVYHGAKTFKAMATFLEARSGVRRRSAAHDARRRDIADAELCDLASLSRDRPTSGAHRASWWFALRQSNNSEERNALEHAREGHRRERREPAEGPDADGQAGAAAPPLRQPAARDAERHGAALNGPRPHADPDGRDAVAVLHRAAR